MSAQKLLKEYEEALASQTWGLVEPLIHSDACMTFSSGTYKGIKDIQKIFEHNFTVIKGEQYRVSNIHWLHSNHINATCVYEFNWQGVINGEHCAGGGRGTCVMLCSNGKWQIITEHLGPIASQ